ncbi:MAG: ABC transporter ATP-binding protein [Candidatus Zixiibacteriota bacterium]|nr:MAG: ABC transporter ATP-binding protein [candidate division Zixibacteria bacterium]
MLDKIKWFWGYYRRYPYVLFVLLFLTPVQTVFQVSIPRMIDFTVDFLDAGEVPSDWLARHMAGLGHQIGLTPDLTFGLGFILLGLSATLLYAFVQSHRAWMNIKLEWLFRQDAFNDITYKGPDFFNRFRTGDLVTRMTDDVAEKLSWFACSGIFRLYEALLMVAFTVTMMITIDPVLTLWAVGPLPVLIVIFFKSSSLLDKRYDHLQSRISRFNDIMEACFSGIRVIKAYVREKAQKSKFETAALDRRSAEISSIKASTVIDSLYMYIWQLSILIILVAGGYLVMQADLSRGKLGSFIFYTVWLVFPMFDIGQFLVKSRQSAVSINRLEELRKVNPMVLDGGDRSADGDVKGELAFEKVSFAFEKSERNILDDVSIKVRAGSTVALVGKVGSGKSWLVNMVPRLVDPTGGVIHLDGHDLRRFRIQDLRRSVGYVPQEPVLFSDTVRNNILLGREEVSEDTLRWAVEVAQLKEEIDSFPDGLNTFIGTRGMSISGGQKQRLGLARALVGKPKILILDDCTSALDSRTESALWERLHEVLPDMTSILITHRPDTLQRADMIYVLHEGSVVETGTHDVLISNGGQYARIYKRFQLEELVR